MTDRTNLNLLLLLTALFTSLTGVVSGARADARVSASSVVAVVQGEEPAAAVQAGFAHRPIRHAETRAAVRSMFIAPVPVGWQRLTPDQRRE